jgi:predicted Zn finger-like uncharacterized protein
MKIECPQCQSHYEIDSEYIGKRIQCPNCENSFDVENPNLIACPDCFSKISPRANSCPRCGKVLRKLKLDNNTDEEIIAEYNPSPLNYLGAIIVSIATTLFLIFSQILYFLNTFSYFSSWIGLLHFLPLLITMIYIIIAIQLSSYTLTTKRLISRKGFFSSKQTNIFLKDVNNYEFSQRLGQALLNLGDIIVETSSKKIYVIGVSNPEAIAKQINEMCLRNKK